MKKNLLTLILLITTVCWSNSVFAQPANNECSGAEFIAVAPGGFDLQFGPYDNTDATSEATDPADPGFPDTDSGLTNTLWYQFVGDGNTYFIYTSAACAGFDISNDDYITDGDTQMAVYTGDCGTLELLAASEDNFMVPGYASGNFAAGIVIETEAGVTYSIMIDGFGGAAGDYCVTTTDILPAPCDTNLDLLPDLPTEVVLCPTDDVLFAVDPATLSFGPEDYIPEGRAGTVAWVFTTENPMGEDPFNHPTYAGFTTDGDPTTSDFTLPGTTDGTLPYGGDLGTLSEMWFTPFILHYDANGDLYFANCAGWGGSSVHVTWVAEGEGDCADLCGEANVDLAEGTATMVTLCLGDEFTIAANDATANYGGLIGANPVPAYLLNLADPMGEPLAEASMYAGFLVTDPEPLVLTGDGIADTLWITMTLFEDYDAATGTIITAECLPYSETVMVVWLAEDDPACAVVECGIAEGDAGAISTDDPTTICIDGEADMISFTSSYAGMGNYGYVVTDAATGEILTPGVVGTTEWTNDFDGAGFGVCNAYGITWENDEAAAFAQGGNFDAAIAGLGEDACYDITAPVAITREDCTPEPLETSDAATSDDGVTYTVTFNIAGGSGNYSADGGTIDMNGTFTSDAIACGTAYSFTITDDEGQSTTVAGDAPCEEVVVEVCPIVLDIQEDCTGDEGGIVTITITGGTAPYSVGGTITDDVDGNVYSFPIGENTEYNLEITDASGCTPAPAVGILVCSKCGNEGGAVQETTGGSSTACGTANVSVTAAGSVETEGSVIVYILHSDQNDALGSVLASNTTGVFSRADAGGMSGTYYVTAYVGVDGDFDGSIDFFGDECTVASANALAVTFADGTELTIDVAEDCDEDAELVTVTATVTGGGAGATYAITGTFEGTVSEGEEFSFAGIADGDTYTINATQIGGCGGASLTSDPVICQKEDAVEWLSFDGEVQTSGNFLQWVTASETNNEYFAVERSLDGKNFETITTVKAAGESSVATSYNYLDRTAPAGTSYYRVTQFDFDGQNDATNVISLTRGEGSFTITNVRPVPAVDYVEFTFTSIENSTVEVSVYDLTGRVMLKANVEATNGINNQSIDVSTYPAGIYMISLNNGTEVATQRLVKD